MPSELLVELVSRYSPSRQETPAVEYLVGWMQAHGFEAHIDEVGNAFGRRGSADAPHTLMLLGHIDTVPGEILVRIEDGLLYGRGSVDAKGSLCAFADATALATIPDGWQIIVVGAVEEEVATSKGAHYIRDHFCPDLCIIGEPSGADRITLGYKGRLLVDFSLTRPLAHTARPEPSVGAIGAAFWNDVLGWCAIQNEGYTAHYEQVMPHLRSINTESDGFQDTVRLTVGFRLPPHHTPTGVFAEISPFTPPDAVLHHYSMEQAYQGDKNNALVRGMLSAIRGQGGRPAFVLKTGTSDMNVVGTKWNCPIVAYGPGDSNLDHTPNEHLPIAEYDKAVAVLQHLIEHL